MSASFIDAFVQRSEASKKWVFLSWLLLVVIIVHTYELYIALSGNWYDYLCEETIVDQNKPEGPLSFSSRPILTFSSRPILTFSSRPLTTLDCKISQTPLIMIATISWLFDICITFPIWKWYKQPESLTSE